MMSAVEIVIQGASYRKVSEEKDVSKSALQRYVKKFQTATDNEKENIRLEANYAWEKNFQRMKKTFSKSIYFAPSYVTDHPEPSNEFPIVDQQMDNPTNPDVSVSPQMIRNYPKSERKSNTITKT